MAATASVIDLSARQSLDPSPAGGAPDADQSTSHQFAATLEAELRRAIQAVSHEAARMREAAASIISSLDKAQGQAQQVAMDGAVTSDNVATVAAATNDLAETTIELRARAENAALSSKAAVGEVVAAQATVSDLHRASGDIGAVVDTINAIAKQTNMLALNATIEAARAGAAGRGFAVVAAEVKNLANETAAATASIAQKVQGIQAATDAAVMRIQAIGHTLEGLERLANEMNERIATQAAVTDRIRSSAQDAAGATARVDHDANAVSQAISQIHGGTGRLDLRITNVNQMTESLEQRLVIALRESQFGDRRAFPRTPVDMPATITAGAQIPGKIINLSAGGALFVPQAKGAEKALHAGQKIELRADGIGQHQARVIGTSQFGAHVEFVIGSDARERLSHYVQELEARDKPLIAKCKETAAQIAGLFEAAIRKGNITLADLFDEDYQAIPGTNPTQHMTKFVALTDRLLPPIQEKFLTNDKRIVFCAAVDRNGFLPTHNLVYSKPHGSDPVWNNANGRNRRIFNDRTGLSAGASVADHLLQTYQRDMGGGQTVMMKDLSAPISVQGRHWGGFRIGFRING